MTNDGNNANHEGNAMNNQATIAIISTGIGTAAAATIDILGKRAKVTVSLKRAKHFSFHAAKAVIAAKKTITFDVLKDAGMEAGRLAVEEAKTLAFNADAGTMFDDLPTLDD